MVATLGAVRAHRPKDRRTDTAAVVGEADRAALWKDGVI